MRRTGPEQVHLVHGAGGPLGGDEFALDIERGRRWAAAGAQRGATSCSRAGPAEPATRAVSARGRRRGRLDWRPEPTVVCAGAALSRLAGPAGPGAGAVLREIAVLGRHGERGGRYRGELVVDVGGHRCWRTARCSTAPTRTVRPGRHCRRAGGGHAGAGRPPQPPDLPAVAAGEEPGLRWA